MVMTNTVNRSRELAQLTLKNMSDVNYLKFTQAQGAPFRVLKLPEIPSVLIETAYISNPTEEALLRTPAFQEEIAGAIATALVKFVPSGQPPVPVHVARTDEKTAPATVKSEEKAREGQGAAPAKKKTATKTNTADERKEKATADPPKAKKNGATTYRVKKDDTLEKIADRNGTTVAELLKLNNMKLKDPLYVDRKLKIPAPSTWTEEKAAPEVITYKVKKGDSLERIALRHHTTVRSIRTLNNLKPNEPVQAGRTIKVPVEKPDEDLPAEPVGTAKAPKPAAKKTAEAEPAQKVTTYRVKKGDTLGKIATRQNTTIAELLKLNNMKLNEPLYIDRKLKVPVAEQEKGRDVSAEKKTAAKPPKAATYVVKKGDTLEKIASKHNTTIAALMKANKIRPNEPLYVNRKLIIPAEADI